MPYHQEKLFCCLVWLGSRFPDSDVTTVSSDSVPLTGCILGGTGWSAQRYSVKCQVLQEGKRHKMAYRHHMIFFGGGMQQLV